MKCFDNFNEIEINFIGSVAHFLTKEIKECLSQNHLKSGNILRNPIKKLIEFHLKEVNNNLFTKTN